jgi:hypothetical protein
MKRRFFLILGMILVISILAGCQSESLKSSNILSKTEQTIPVEPAAALAENPDTNCAAVNPHPLGQSMAETFEISYDEVMTLYCDGYAFSDILLALETSTLVDQTPAALLARLRTRSWQEIWDEFGVDPQ